MKRLRVGIIGLGVGARHAAGYAAHPGCEIAALCDAQEDVLKEIGSQYPQARHTTDVLSVLQDPAIDAVSIASYDADHYAQVTAALEAGKHVFAEKPLCLKEEEAQHIRQLLRERPRLKLSSHFPLRQVPRFREVRDQVAAGRLGRVYLAEASYLYGRWHKITDGWRGETPGFSPLLGGGVHLIDLLMWLTGETVTEAVTFGTNIAGRDAGIAFDDCTVSLLKFESGLVAQLTCDLAGVHPHYHGLALYGTEATFRNGRHEAELFTSREGEPTAVTSAYRQERQEESAPFFTSFVDYVLGQGQPEVTADDVFAGLSVAFAALRSLASGRPEKVEYI